MKDNILKELEYMIEKSNDLLDLTDNNENKEIREQHLIALGQNMALNDLKYSIIYNSWRFGVNK